MWNFYAQLLKKVSIFNTIDNLHTINYKSIFKAHIKSFIIMYIDDDRNEHDSYDDYCNSDMLDPDIVASYLLCGKRKPKNDYEKALLQEMKDIQKSGHGIKLNFN